MQFRFDERGDVLDTNILLVTKRIHSSLDLVQKQLADLLVLCLRLLRLRLRRCRLRFSDQVFEVLCEMILPLLLLLVWNIFFVRYRSVWRSSTDLIELIESPSDLIWPGPAHDLVPYFVVLALDHNRPITSWVENPVRFCLQLFESLLMLASVKLVFLLVSLLKRLRLVKMQIPLCAELLLDIYGYFLRWLCLCECLHWLRHFLFLLLPLRFRRFSAPSFIYFSYYLLHICIKQSAVFEVLVFVIKWFWLLHYFFLLLIICCLLH